MPGEGENQYPEAPNVPETVFYSQRYVGAGTGAKVPLYGPAAEMKAKRRATVRRSFDSGRLEPGIYQVRVRRLTPKSTEDNVSDEIYLSDLNEVTMLPLSYPNTALLGLKIPLGEQINAVPSVSFMHGGKIVRVHGKPAVGATAEEWHDAPSRNPAWIVWNMLIAPRYGAGLATARLDFPAFKRWARYCEAEGLTWDGPIDSEMNVWDACQLVLRVGRAQLVNIGTRYTIVVERAAAPVMMFSVANMVKDSYRETWLSLSDRANEIDVTFFDKEDLYRERTVKVYDPESLTAGRPQRTSSVTLYGVTDYEKAYQEGMFMLNLNRYVLKTVTFSAPLEAVACTVGDLVYVQHDMPAWAQAGRLKAGSSATSLVLDRPVTMEAGKDYKVMVIQDVVQRHTGTVHIVAQSWIYLTGYPGNKRVTRLQVGGKDYRVADVGPQGSGYVVVDKDFEGAIAPGMAYTLYDTDVIEEAGVQLVVGESSTIALQSPLSLAPPQFTQWMFGESTRVKSPFRVRSISTGASDMVREITALQYDERVYDNSRFASQHVPIQNPKDIVISQVRSLELYEETRVVGQQIVSGLVAAWQAPQVGHYGGADVYVRKNDATAWEKVGDVKNRSSVDVAGDKGEKVAVKIVAFDIFGKRATFDDAPTAELEVKGELGEVDVGDVTGADVYWQGRDCRITWRYNSKTNSYEFGSEPAGADAGALDPQFKDYQIRVFEMDEPPNSPPRRVEVTTDNSYVYTYEKNRADGITRKLRFEIRMRDKANNLGKPTTLTAYNPPPRILSVQPEPTFESCTVTFQHSADPDFSHTLIWLSEFESQVAGDIDRAGFDERLVYQGPDNSVVLSKLMFNKLYYMRMAAVDVFGRTELLPTDVLSFRTTHLNVDAIAEGVLAGSKLIPALQERINLVDGPATMAGSVAARLLDEAQQRQAAITTEKTERQAADSSLASQITTLTASVGSNAAAISTEQTARVNGDNALATQLTTLATRVGNAESSIVTEQSTRAGADSAMASQISAIQTSVNNNAAAITAEQTARANGDSANASSISTLWSSVGEHTTALQVQASSINGLSGQYTVKIDNNGYVAGFGLASYPTTSGITSEFVVRADKFAIQMPGYPGIYPFTVGAVNGVPRVIISNALIGDASISSAKIGDLQVNTSNIAQGAITNAYATSTSSNIAAFFVSVPPNSAALIIQAAGAFGYTPPNGDDPKQEAALPIAITIDGAQYAFGWGATCVVLPNPPTGNFYVGVIRDLNGMNYFTGQMQLIAQVCKR